MAIVFLSGAAATVVVRSNAMTRYLGVELNVMWVDISMLIAVIAILIDRPRLWIAMTAALQLVTVTFHFAKAVDHSIIATAYKALISVWAYPQLALLVFATWKAIDRQVPRTADQP